MKTNFDQTIQSPLETLGFNREIFTRLTEKQAYSLVKKMHDLRIQKLHPDTLAKMPINPEKLSERRRTPEAIKLWGEVTKTAAEESRMVAEAYGKLKDPEKFKKFLSEYKAISDEEQLRDARELLKDLKRETKAKASSFIELFRQFFSNDPNNLRQLKACELKLTDVIANLNLESEFGDSIKSPGFDFLFRKNIIIDSDGFIVTSADEQKYKTKKRPFILVNIPKNMSPGNFLDAINFKILESDHLLEYQGQKTEHKFRYFIDGLPLMQIVNNRKEPSDYYKALFDHASIKLELAGGNKQLLISSYFDARYNDSHCLEIEGIIESRTDFTNPPAAGPIEIRQLSRKPRPVKKTTKKTETTGATPKKKTKK